MNEAELAKFQKCLAAAAMLVAAYRAQAPEGFDPRADTSVSSPAPLDYQSLLQQEITGLSSAAPKELATAGKYDPQFNALSLSNISQDLFGSPGGTSQVQNGTKTVYYNPKTGQTSNTIPMETVPNPAWTGALSGGARTIQQPAAGWIVQNNPVYTTQTTPASQGIVSMMSQAQRQSAQGTADTIQAVGPQMTAAYNAANPQGASLVKQLGDAASTDLSSGYNLPPGLENTVDQAVKQSQVGTLGGTGNAAAYGQALGMSQFANQLYMQRLQNMYNALGSNQNFYGSVIPTISGSGANSMAGASYVNSTANGGQFQPDVNFNDLTMTNYNASAAANIASANNTAALEAAGIKAAGSLIGAGMAGA